MVKLPVVSNCNGCIACCVHVMRPPFAVSYVGEEGKEYDPTGFVPVTRSPEDLEDFARLRNAPPDARRLMWEGISRNKPSPCTWLDLENLRCRYYAHRPGVCRQLEVSGERCLAHRRNVGVRL